MPPMLILIIILKAGITFHHSSSSRWSCRSSWHKFKWRDKEVCNKLLVELIIGLISKECHKMDLLWAKVQTIRHQTQEEHRRSQVNQLWDIKLKVHKTVDQMVETSLEAIRSSSNHPTTLQHTNKYLKIKDKLLNWIFIKLNSNNLIMELLQKQQMLQRWIRCCIRHSKITHIWEIVCKALIIRIMLP